MYDNSLRGRVYLNATPTAGATGTGEQTLMTYSLPANSLCQNGQGLVISAGFKNNSSDTITWKLYFGSETFSGSCTTTTAGKAAIEVFRTGSKTQTVMSSGVAAGTTNVTPSFTAATEDDTAAITIKLTATAGASGANATAEYLSVEFLQAA